MPVQRATIDSFPLGLDRSLPPDQIPDGALSDVLNMYLNDRGQPTARRGTTELSDFTGEQRITSIYDFHDGSGNLVLYTAGSTSGLLIAMQPGGGGDTNITGTLTLPFGTLWQWVTFDDIAIGVNRGTGANDNPIKVTDTSTPVAEALGGSPPKGRYIEAWNSRIFIVPEDEPFVIRWSALGNAEDWTTTGRAGAGAQEFSDQTYGEIRGIKAQKTRLLIFRERSIEMLVPGSPNVDSDQWEFQTLTTSVGCLSAYSIKPVLNDLVFASNHGIASLSAVERFGDFNSAILSQRIPELRDLNVSRDSYPAVVNTIDSQYWISIPSGNLSSTNERVWILDFSNGLDQSSPWMLWDAATIGASYGIVEDSGQPRVYIGGETQIGTVLRYGDGFSDRDDGVTSAGYRKIAETKHFDIGEPIQRKDFYKILMSFLTSSDSVVVNITWFLDGQIEQGKTASETFLGPEALGLIWDDGVWGENWSGSQGLAGNFFISTLRGGPGRRGRTLGIRVFNAQEQDLTLATLVLQFALLNERFIE